MAIDKKDYESFGVYCAHCILCGSTGEMVYHGLRDHLYGTKGVWNIKRCPDPSCGLAWLDPKPSPETISSAYCNYHTHRKPAQLLQEHQRNRLFKNLYIYLKNGYLAMRYGYPITQSYWQKFAGLILFCFPQRLRILDRSVMELKMIPGGRLLDIGCGNGQLLANLQGIGWQVQGVEVDPEAVEVARGKNLEVRLGTVKDQNYSDSYFDVITMSHVIEHVHEPIILLEECRRILKTGGQIIIRTPNLQSLGHSLFKDAWRGLEPPRHLYLYSCESMKTIVERAGFLMQSLVTSAHIARFIYLDSWAISSRGISSINLKIPWVTRFRAGTFFWIEWAMLKLKPNVGEELVLTAIKEV
jgi:2-polyprenyl-3-methyl-5-hydroxy-6-metoxy-1,4-benzoquinol methylase